MSRARWRTKIGGVSATASGVGPDLALSDHGPCFVSGTVTLDDISFAMLIAYISRATLDSERHWTFIDLGTGNFVWVPTRLRGYCVEQCSANHSAARHRNELKK